MRDLFEEPSAYHAEMFVAPVEKKTSSRFSRNCASRILLTPFGDICRLSICGHGIQLATAAKKRYTIARNFESMANIQYQKLLYFAQMKVWEE
jgi:hypothetical protein